MAAPTTTDSFLDLVAKSQLIAPERLEAALRQIPANRLETPRHVAGVLLGAGLLTQFQAQQLLQGKHRGFAIGKYRVLERLGHGGGGTIYLCEHTLMRRRVAIKVLPSSRAANPALLMRFYREGRASGSLDHPNLVRCHDIDCDGNLHFLVMDYIDGSSLQHIVGRSGSLEVARACHYVRDAALALAHAHRHGLVHRDIKPANIMVDRTGVVKVLDLGLARFFNDEDDPLTLKYDDNHVLGTADYVSPEQIVDSHNVDIRTDIYSLGATLYFALTGGALFPEGKPSEKMLWHQVRMPKPVGERNPRVPAELAAVVSMMLAKDRTRRYQEPFEVYDALEPWTRQPIGPPEDTEMPQLSLAAQLAGANPGAARLADVTDPNETPRRPMSFTMDEIATPNAVIHSQTPTDPDVDATPIPMPRETVLRRTPRPRKSAPARRRFGTVGTALLVAGAIAVGVLIRLATAWFRGS